MKVRSNIQCSAIIILLFGTMMACSLSSCRHTKKEVAAAISDRSQMPVLDAKEVSTLISDSGVTRYRINAARWQIYDKARPAYWEFIDGIYLEKFTEDLRVEASIQSDYAHYNEESRLWTLKGNVHAMNLAGEIFDTQLLYWDQQTERIYSDSMIHIIRANSTIHGYGFDSNQQMTKYTILHPTGIFPVQE